MKKNKITYIIISLSIIFGLSSCSDYLDNAPDDIVDLDEVFANRKYSEQFLANVYNYTKQDNGWSNTSPWTAISDELDVTYPDYVVSNMNLGALTPDKGWYDFWPHFYKGIRAASIFINRIDENNDFPGGLEYLKTQYKAEARFLRAWYYFNLVRQYGPVVILPEDVISPDATIDQMTLPRSPISQCFNYIINELDAIIEMGILPKENYGEFSDSYGRITEGTCRALKSRALLYAASDLYNNDRNGAFYDNFRNADGTLLLDYTDADRTKRWQEAANAALDIINMKYSLYIERDATGTIDVFSSYKKTFIENWNSEVIWGKKKGGFWEMDMAGNPRVLNAWGGWGPTQKIVDAFYTKNGLPIKTESAFPLTKDPIYTEEGFTENDGDNGYTQKGTYNMYTNREPRFYISIMFNNARTRIASLSTANQKTVEFFYGGNSGRTDGDTRNFPQTGYLANKLVNLKSNPLTGSTTEHVYIVFRLGEIYLNYIEALNEVDYNANKATIITYLNKIRERAGVPLFGNESGMIAPPVTQDAMRQIIRRERQIELAFETNRYFDCVRWNTAAKEFSGPFEGMNIYGRKDNFHKRVIFETRVFDQKNLLYPITLSELYRGKNLVQNPGWSGN